MIISDKQAKSLWIKKTLDLKEILLADEGYYKVRPSLKNDIFVYWLYIFALTGLLHTIAFYIYPIIK